MAATATLQLTFAALSWNDNIATHRFSIPVPREFPYVPNATHQTEFDSLYVMWKRIILGGDCPWWQWSQVDVDRIPQKT